MELPFPVSEYKSRIEKTRQLMQAVNADVLITFGDLNDYGHVTYLANLEPILGRDAVIVTRDKVSLVTDNAFHGEPMHSLVWKTWIEDIVVTEFSTDDFGSTLRKELGNMKGPIGIVGTYAFPYHALPGLKFLDVERDFLSRIRGRKSDLEIQVMKECSRIVSSGMRAAIEAVAEGVRETDVAAAGCKAMFEAGASRTSFPPLVTSGLRAGVKQDYASRRRIEDGDLVYVDIGAVWHSYQTDMARTMLVGEGTEKQRDALDSIFEIYSTLLKEIKPGAPASEVARHGEEIAKARGWLQDYWSQGHGIGTSLMEIPNFTLNSQDTFDAGMTMAFEPAIVNLSLGTAVIEDDILITEDGCKSMTECERVLW